MTFLHVFLQRVAVAEPLLTNGAHECLYPRVLRKMSLQVVRCCEPTPTEFTVVWIEPFVHFHVFPVPRPGWESFATLATNASLSGATACLGMRRVEGLSTWCLGDLAPIACLCLKHTHILCQTLSACTAQQTQLWERVVSHNHAITTTDETVLHALSTCYCSWISFYRWGRRSLWCLYAAPNVPSDCSSTRNRDRRSCSNTGSALCEWQRAASARNYSWNVCHTHYSEVRCQLLRLPWQLAATAYDAAPWWDSSLPGTQVWFCEELRSHYALCLLCGECAGSLSPLHQCYYKTHFSNLPRINYSWATCGLVQHGWTRTHLAPVVMATLCLTRWGTLSRMNLPTPIYSAAAFRYFTITMSVVLTKTHERSPHKDTWA